MKAVRMLLLALLLGLGGGLAVPAEPALGFDPGDVVIAGATYDDVYQGAAPTCSLLAALSAAAWSGVDLGKSVRHLGGGRFAVVLDGKEEVVAFDGRRQAIDPAPRPETPREFWPVLFQRAYLQRFRVDASGNDVELWVAVVNGKHTEPGAQEWRRPSVALRAVTGKPARCFAPRERGARQALAEALRARRPVVAATAVGVKDGAASILVANHAYAVLALDERGVLLRNPWGRDAGADALEHDYYRPDPNGRRASDGGPVYELKPEYAGRDDLRATLSDRSRWHFKSGVTDGMGPESDPHDGLVRIPWALFERHFDHFAVADRGAARRDTRQRSGLRPSATGIQGRPAGNGHTGPERPPGFAGWPGAPATSHQVRPGHPRPGRPPPRPPVRGPGPSFLALAGGSLDGAGVTRRRRPDAARRPRAAGGTDTNPGGR